MTFLHNDKTDSKIYDIVSFPCGAFAEEVHNNAEANGIRAAWVAIDFADSTDGHACNAFETTDMGLVYVDCVNYISTLSPIQYSFGTIEKTFGAANGADKIAYLQIGKEYGMISIDVASSPSYSFYEQYKDNLSQFKSNLQECNTEIKAYNAEAETFSQWQYGRIIYAGTPDASRQAQWYNSLETEKQRLESTSESLDTIGNSLGAFWQPLGIVKDIKIYRNYHL